MKFLIKFYFILFILAFFTYTDIDAKIITFDVSNPPEKSVVKFTSKALTEEFDGTASQIQGSLNIDFTKPDLQLSGKFSVPVSSMKTGLSMRDKHMLSRDWLDVNRHPLILFDLKPSSVHSVKKTGAQQWNLWVKGQFSLKGISKEIEVPATLSRNSKNPDQIVIEGTFRIHLDDFGIHGPMGMRLIGARVSPDVDVKIQLKGKAQKPW